MKKMLLIFLALSNLNSLAEPSQQIVFVDLGEVFGYFFHQAEDGLRNGNSSNSPFLKLIAYRQAYEDDDTPSSYTSDTSCDCCDITCSSEAHKRYVQLDNSLSEEIAQKAQKIAGEMGAYAIFNDYLDFSFGRKIFVWVNPRWDITKRVIGSLSNDWLFAQNTAKETQSCSPQRIFFVNIKAILNDSNTGLCDPSSCNKPSALFKHYPTTLEFSYLQKIHDEVCNSFLQKIEPLENKASTCENKTLLQKTYADIELAHQDFLKTDSQYKDALKNFEEKIKNFAITVAQKLHADILLTSPSLLECGLEDGFVWSEENIDITPLVINELNNDWLTSHKQ